MRSALMRRVATVQRIVERVEAEACGARQHEARALAKGLHRLETTLDAKLELVLGCNSSPLKFRLADQKPRGPCDSHLFNPACCKLLL